MKTFLLSLAAATVAFVPGAAKADEFTNGLKTGAIITTCQYVLNDVFADPKFGTYMVEAQYSELPSDMQRMVIKLWNERGAGKCIHAAHGHSH